MAGQGQDGATVPDHAEVFAVTGNTSRPRAVPRLTIRPNGGVTISPPTQPTALYNLLFYPEINIQTNRPTQVNIQAKDLMTAKITQGQVDEECSCAVCLKVYVVDEEVKQLTCGHCYHESCIMDWLKEKAICPMCRNKIQKPA